MLIAQVAFVHRVTVKEQDNGFLNIEKNTNGNKRQRLSTWDPPTGIEDSVITNCPILTKNVGKSVLHVTQFWNDRVCGFLRTGQKTMFLKAAAVSIARCCCNASGLVFKDKLLDMAYTRTNFPSSDSFMRGILKYASSHEEGEPIGGIEETVAQEALETITDTILRVWEKVYDPKSNNMIGARKRFWPVIAFVNTWHRIAEWYCENPNHKIRDSRMSHVTSLADNGSERHIEDGTLVYPVNTDPSIMVHDFYFKLLVELIMSPHHHIEWKIEMCKFIIKDAYKMISAFTPDIYCSGNDIVNGTATCEYGRQPVDECLDTYNGPRFNPTRLQPCAANFWDFCRSGRPPSDARYVLLFNEPSVCPELSSGAGAFAMYIGEGKNPKHDIISSALSNLLCLENCDSLSTRRWREEGNVLCLNFCPLTCARVLPGFGEHRAKGMSKGYWIKTIQRAVLGSSCRLRNMTDKSCRTSDLLSDSGNVSLETVMFGCERLMKELTNVSHFDIRVNFHEPIFIGPKGADRIYRSQTTISSSFPALI